MEVFAEERGAVTAGSVGDARVVEMSVPEDEGDRGGL